jgi:ComF family protein
MNFPDQEGLPGNTYLCALCRKKEWAFDLARSLFVFDGPVREAIHLMKYHGHFSVGIWLGSQMTEALNDTLKNTHTSDIFDGNRNENAMIIPVPLSSKRLRDREFNHAFLLAKSVGKAFNLLINPVALERIRDSKPQVGLTTQERWPNVRGVFKIKNPNMVKEKKIILFDDVLTTGATVNECARVLKKAGANRVVVLTLARTL